MASEGSLGGPAGEATEPAGGFPRAARLLSPARFTEVLKAPALIRRGPFAMHACSCESVQRPQWQKWRLGLVIPKRHEASAARRNAIKRRWREAFRLRRETLDRQFVGHDLVVRMTAPLTPAVKRGTAKRAATAGRPAPPFDAARLLDALIARMSARRDAAESGKSV